MTAVDRRTLRWRMLASLALLVLVTVGFVAGVWGAFYLVLVSFEADGAALIASVASGVLLASLVGLEFLQVSTVERFAGATPVARDEEPDLYRTTTRVASQLDIPVPTIAISDSPAPEALVVGFRRDGIHLVLSEGTIDVLDDAELEAVIAHELAHVRNRDATVMTAVSAPVVLAAGLRSRLPDPNDAGMVAVVVLPLALVSNGAWVAGRTITAVLARVREHAADRAAAEVTGSPAALASALETLDERIEATPTRDLRSVEGVSALSILPLERDPDSRAVRLGPDGETEPSHLWFDRLKWRLFVTHPPTADRLESLRSLEREHQRGNEREPTTA
ncbi:M48 family metalloprotease [Natronococcus sp. A-GB1]|uniref:M48 family metalloprotease n=1 Tax=Natronococcus sp. A-GB1 TaxID=3037648 RepID=UPI00241C441C|nr:M48 family metalloprotease [Natronococcus sp. A-GB1]MDG5757763.1 M48 family metalloprotease [Natronococcus sp. A-GB1]